MKTINLKYQLQREMTNLNYLTDRILYQKSKILLSILKKKHEERTENPTITTYINKI